MRTRLMKKLLGAIGLTATLLLGAAAQASTTVELAALRTTLTLPDGTVAPMWGYCGGVDPNSTGIVTGGGCQSVAANGNFNWSQGPTIIVPSGDTLTINLFNTLPTPTSITIVGQLGGGLGNPNYVASPAHNGVSLTTFVGQAQANFTPPAQGPRARSFVPEADGLGAGVTGIGMQSYVWNNLKPGTYLYQSGSRPSLQVPMGLYGVLIVTATPAVTPVPGGPNQAYVASSGTASYPLAYDADATFLFSEVDVLQNTAVDTAAQAMAAATAPTAANADAFAALEQRVAPNVAGNNPISNPSYQPNAGQPDCATIACYPPAVNYAPTYFLLNGQSYDRSNPAASAAIVSDTTSATTPSGRVLVRLLNAGLKTHIPTLVGLTSTLIAEDGNLLPDVQIGLLKSHGSLVSGKAQSAILLPAGKTTDVVITPPGSQPGSYTDAAYPILDRELSLSGGGKSFAGLQGYLAIAPPGTGTANLASVLSTAAAQGKANSTLPVAVAVAANNDVFQLPAGTTVFSGNLLGNDVGVTGTALVGNGAATTPDGSFVPVSVNPDGSFTIGFAGGGVIPDGTSFVYTGNQGTVSATATFHVTSTAKDTVTAPAQTFNSQVASLIHVPHPGVLGAAASSGNYTLQATAAPAAGVAPVVPTVPPAGQVLPSSSPACSGPGSCTVQLFTDGSFIATASVPGSYTFGYAAVDAQGVSASGTATVVFPVGSGAQVTLQDSVTGLPLPVVADAVSGRSSQDYRWVIEEDQTYLHDPGNPGFVPPTAEVPLSAIRYTPVALSGGIVSPQLTVSYGAGPQYFQGFVPGTYVQISGATTDAFNGVFRINTVSGSASAGGSFTVTLWETPAAAPADATNSGMLAHSGQSLATNFHRSYMPVVASGCTGSFSCNDNQTIGGAPVTPAPRSLPADVLLDPTKRYYISVLPGDAGATTFTSVPAAASGHSLGAAGITGAQITAAASNPVTVLVPQNPLPPGQMSFITFEDNNPVNGDIDDTEQPLGGFEIVLYDTRGSSGDQAGQITYDLFNQPLTNALANTAGTGTDGKYYSNLCPTTPNGAVVPVGVIYTCMPVLVNGQDVSPFTGMALVKNVIPGRIDVQAHPAAWREAAGEQWIQVSTLEGTPNNDSFVHAGEPAYWQEFGPPGFHAFIGFLNPAHIAAVNADTVKAQPRGTPLVKVTGRATNLHMDRPPQAKLNDSCQSPTGSQAPGSGNESCARAALNYTNCYAALNSQSGNGATIAFAACDGNGNFTLENVPPDSYELFIWDQWLDQIKAQKLVVVPPDSANGAVIATGDTPVFNWFTRIQETQYLDLNGNGVRDPGEPGISNLQTHVRFRDGTLSNLLTTDSSGNAFHNELFPLFNWYVLESDMVRYKNTGVHVIYDAGGIPDQKPLSGLAASEYFDTTGVLNSSESFPVPAANRIPGARYNTGTTERVDPPNVLFEGMQGFINQTEFVEWGKQPFAPGENGGINGMVYFASVRAFDDPRLKVQNLSEPGIPRVKVNLYQRVTNADGTTRDVLVDSTTSNSWDDWANGTGGFGTPGVPNLSCPGNAPASANPPAYVAGKTDPFINYTLGPANQFKCYDGQHAFNQVQPAVYDGFYSFPTAACKVCSPVLIQNNHTGRPATNPDGSARAPVPTLPPGEYVVEVVRPDGFDIIKEEDKNILIGDTWISAGPQQFGNLTNIFILPDQATLDDQNPQGFGRQFPPCVGTPHVVPDYLTVVPEAQQSAPFAGQVRNLCDRKLVTVVDQQAANADFQLFTPAPISGHISGLMLNDAAAEFDPFSPSFGEKYALPNAPISVRDFNGVEVMRGYTDKWGTFDFLNPSTWEANVPNPSGYAPNMLTYCMNDPGPTPVPGQPGRFQIDPYYNSSYSDFCYNWPTLPGVTTYLDTPVLPVAAFAMHYAPVDCQYSDATPAILRVDGNWTPSSDRAFLPPTVALPSGPVGPFVDLGSAAAQLTITALGDTLVMNPAYAGPQALPGTAYANSKITRHYGFGASQGSTGSVQLLPADGSKAITLNVSSWSDLKLVASVPSSVPLGDYQLVVVAANGKKTVDAVTVSVDNSVTNRHYRAPWYVAAPPPGAGIGSGVGYGLPHPIQDAIDNPANLPGDLVIIDAGLYPELDVLWKPLRLQGVGAAAVTIQATKYPNVKLADWRNRINLLFGLDPEGNQFPLGAANPAPAQVDPLPGQELSGGIVRLEPSALSTEEGAGITVLSANVQRNPFAPTRCPTLDELAALSPPMPLQNFAPATPFGFYPTASPSANPSANQPVAATRDSRKFSDFACAQQISGHSARIDGISVTGSDAGGGIYVNGWAHDLQISNNRVFGNSGPYAGGVRIGQPYLEGQVPNREAERDGGYLAYNVNVKVHHNAIFTNGTDEANAAPGNLVGTSGAGGGLSIDAGSDNFVVSNNWICGNFSAGDGGGLGVVGNSTPGLIQNNAILFNESYQQTGPSYGGGLAIEGEPSSGTAATTGVGNIVVDGNLIQGNGVRSGSGGGVRLAGVNGSEVREDFHWTVSLTNNMITNNVAGWAGGGVSMADTAWSVLFGNTIADNDATGVAGNLMNSRVNGISTGPTTAVPSPAGVASDPYSPQLRAVLGRLRGESRPASTTLSQPEVMSNNIIWHNRSMFFDDSTGTARLCSSNQRNDAVSAGKSPNVPSSCVQLAAQTATGQCDTANARYWDVGVVGDAKPLTTGFVLDHSVLSAAYPGTGNTSADPGFSKEYCNGSRVTPEAQFEPGSPFQPAFGISASATLDESGNFVDLQWGPLSLNDPGHPATVNGNYHLAGVASSAFNAGVTASAALRAAVPTVSHDIDGDDRPQNGAYDIGADEYVAPYVDVAVSKTDGVSKVAQGATTTYTIVVSNAGTIGVSGVAVSDAMPSVTVATGVGARGALVLGTATLSGSWTCASNTTGASCGAASGTGDINTTVTLPAVGSVTFTVQATVPANAVPGQSFTNTAKATVPAGVLDVNPANNSASDTDTVAQAAVDLSISKVFSSGASNYQPGERVSYTLTVRNAASIPAWLVSVNDTPPTLLSGVSWTCSAGPGSQCGSTSGTGSLGVNSAQIAAGGSLSYTLSGTVPFGTAANTAFRNTATVAVNPNLYTDPVAVNNSSTVSGTVVTDTATLTPSPVAFGSVQTGQSQRAVITLRNTGPLPLFLGSWTVSGNGFALLSTTCSTSTPLPVSAGANSCTFTVQFQPAAPGKASGSFSVVSSAGTLSTTLGGTGQPPALVIAALSTPVLPTGGAVTRAAVVQTATPTVGAAISTLSFGAVQVGDAAAAQQVAVNNTGVGPVTYAGVTLSGNSPGATFAVAGAANGGLPACTAGLVLAAGGSCNLSVGFTAAAGSAGAGSKSATLVANYSAAIPGGSLSGTTQAVSLSASGQLPTGSSGPASLSFGPTPVDAVSAPQYLTVSNTGIGPLTFSGATVTLPGGALRRFQVTPAANGSVPACSSTPMAVGASCSLAVTFAPLTPGPAQGTVVVQFAGGAAATSTPVSGVATVVPRNGPATH